MTDDDEVDVVVISLLPVVVSMLSALSIEITIGVDVSAISVGTTQSSLLVLVAVSLTIVDDNDDADDDDDEDGCCCSSMVIGTLEARLRSNNTGSIATVVAVLLALAMLDAELLLPSSEVESMFMCTVSCSSEMLCGLIVYYTYFNTHLCTKWLHDHFRSTCVLLCVCVCLRDDVVCTQSLIVFPGKLIKVPVNSLSCWSLQSDSNAMTILVLAMCRRVYCNRWLCASDSFGDCGRGENIRTCI